MAKAATTKKKTFRKKEKKNIPIGIVHIAASFNNTMVSITDAEGNLVSQSSSGARGFRGSRKGTPFAAQQAAQEAAISRLYGGIHYRDAIENDQDQGKAIAQFIIEKLQKEGVKPLI